MVVMNPYFQHGDGIGNASEKHLYEDLIIEGLKIYGNLIYYMPREMVNRDLVLGEDVNSKFKNALPIEMYFETTEGFAGQQELINKFGLEIREDTTLVVSKRRFHNKIDTRVALGTPGRPNEGDILFFPLMNSFFEIQFVEDQEPFFQLGNLPVYKLRVTRWEYSNEEIDVGIKDIDKREAENSVNLLVDRVSLENEEGTVRLETDNISDGRANFLLNEEYDATKTTVQTQSDYAQNLDLDTAAGFDTASVTDDVLDFTERNPFGEVDI
jgi:hypothetical protein|tara:strand:+ start:532 stop:1338 length:807 start_codon:yes stop_codon:yes gene_type:complete